MNAKTIIDILKILPHRYPVLLIDKVLEIVPFKKIVAIKNVSANEPYFMGHFPDNPIMPGVLQIEAMAQAGAILLLSSLEEPKVNTAYLLGIDKARFRQKVLPGDQLLIEAEVIKILQSFCKLKAKITVDGILVAEAELLTSAEFLQPEKTDITEEVK
ncbi:MAG: 3-hydroxyacyl-[acyl-carrier-protein] dehydratase FabZ [Candidatus Fischerbacteria bacterium RBG_13_37_8]|uniref:3-hydroxyacyl-[acyl-carrier-protein] dehydratase FabZ n=1 Tax=Candidatus Fischerbacteria bacterium RBG_13_37_8 TaxID=1817863 RepID=A0A1F5VFQ8_9BACT|nr:MAG: 3-hydroxyacyl-[acyl-carrier-protein] dehydratase FabZ [Candidatus Fischerbacteria bacterium RBG_13_37_8]